MANEDPVAQLESSRVSDSAAQAVGESGRMPAGFGRSLTATLLTRRAWCRRIVERVEFFEGRTVRRSISAQLDTSNLPRWVTGQILVPLTACSGDDVPLRDLQVLDPLGNPMPLVPSEMVEACLADGIAALLAAGKSWISSAEEAAKLDQALRHAEHPRTFFRACLDVSMDSDGFRNSRGFAHLQAAVDLARFAAEQKMPTVLLSADFADQECVIRYSYCADFDPCGVGRVRRLKNMVRCLGAAFGMATYQAYVPLPDLRRIGTYHLEMPTPHGLVAQTLEIRTGDGKSRTSGIGLPDKSRSPVSHVRATLSPTAPKEDQGAVLRLIVDPLGNLPLTLGTASLLALVFFLLLAIKLPSATPEHLPMMALDAWSERGIASAGTSVLLFGAAALLALQGRQGESIYTRTLAAPLRVYAFVLATALGATATALIGVLSQDLLSCALWVAASLAALPCFLFWLGRLSQCDTFSAFGGWVIGPVIAATAIVAWVAAPYSPVSVMGTLGSVAVVGLAGWLVRKTASPDRPIGSVASGLEIKQSESGTFPTTEDAVIEALRVSQPSGGLILISRNTQRAARAVIA
jgi:hypothetical protein